ncbi:isochorismate synthase (plasmid) [Roseomonas marmotae]|uniref:isochorismate synthase n=2 Tax=Roseomonas marmotae TaxID=2768161 RepID=A0ABS3KAT4_9PROT|nr:isochorismate synthase [Roseomonas marmotae]MBO1074561.1 isochorismate synthase [Roseomonas marmotae]QTI81593.1 isochorismate synthase [Roseomonas marmotae]
MAEMTRPDAMAAPAGPPAFAFLSGRATILGHGVARALPSGPAATLAGRVADFFREAGPDAVLAGALPFDRAAGDHLVQAREVSRRAPPSAPEMPRARWTLRHDPAPEAFAGAVAEALVAMAAGDLRKVVLSRSLLAEADRPIDLSALLRRLAGDPKVTGFLVPLPDDGGAPRVLAGATPELLVGKTGRGVLSHPLAGSARRQADPVADRAAAAALERSDKDRREHALVSEFVMDTLAPYCRSLAAPEGIQLTTTATMWHLGTRIMGELKDPGVSSAELAAALHPTPAVCGVPREASARLISRLEPYDRGFYAGAVGWCDGRGDGEWHVSIRCAEIAGRRARLYAGAGIVPGSDPAAETAETAAKFGAFLNALGIDEEWRA